MITGHRHVELCSAHGSYPALSVLQFLSKLVVTHGVVQALGRDLTVGTVVSLWAMVKKKKSQVLCVMPLASSCWHGCCS